MSLVGTRPILQDELLKYELHHRARIAIKPGITGMWQVSGRSDITDFEEVVRLDTEYISNWNFGLDTMFFVSMKELGSMMDSRRSNMLQIFNYNAGKGDCLRLRYTGASGISHNILIDSGEIRFGLEFEAICKQIVANHEKIDVMVLSHVDMDHLGGLLYNLRNKIKLSIEEVWMNHGSLMGKNAELSVKQNDEVYTALKEQGIPVKPVIAGTTYELDGAVFRVLWPDEETLYRLFPQPLGNVVLGKPSDYGYSFGELMNMPIKGKDTSPNNRASVIMEVAYKGQKLLFTGDAWAEDILQVVGNSSYDFIKLSHHGSVRNLSEEWSGKIKCQTYMICADGSTHPDKQTIAKLLKWNDEITIYGSTDWWTSMLNIEEQAKLEKIHFEEGEYLWKLPKKE